MQVIKGFHHFNHAPYHTVVTIGNFDGVHLGHREILRIAMEEARIRRVPCFVYTFRPHPQVVLYPEKDLQLLCTYDERIELLASSGVDGVIEEPFDRAFSALEPEEFFENVLVSKLRAEAIVVGYDFAFGKGRHGHLDILKGLCERAGIQLKVVDPFHIENEVISSSKIRKYLKVGDIPAANRLLGRLFSYRGMVIRGEGRGRKIGFPTANLKLEDKLALPYGVYATWASEDGNLYPSITNVGVRPTFDQSMTEPLAPTLGDRKELPALVETYILDQTLDLYGKTLEVRFQERLREERKFPNVGALVHQIQLDVEAARRILNSFH